MSVKKFGPFILDQMIGRGGMGAVYRARDEKTNQVVAVKALLLPLERERERFEAEISTLRLLRHENIVKLYGFGQEDGILYYAMEYVDGPSLATLLRRGRRFSWEETVYIGARICNALKHAHDRGVIHRDIKPANILLVNGGVVKVSDYGIAQYFGASRLTNANQVVGTIEFMAPEQAQAGAVGPKTDVYSLGALMYALLTGRPPYVAKTLPELLQKFREGLPEPIRAERPETPKAVEDVVLDLLQIQPEKRPGDARLIGRRLEALLYSSETCQGGNPFVGSQFTGGAATTFPLSDGRNLSSTTSRVDLENDSTTMHQDPVEDFRPDDEPVGVAKDFPYRPIDGEDAGVGFDLDSPFDKTTERATLEVEHGSSPAQQRDDFFVGDGKDPEGLGLSDSETSTSLLAPSGAARANAGADAPASESGEPSSEVADDASSDHGQYVIQPTLVGDAASSKVGGTAVSTEFDVAYEAGAAGGSFEPSGARTETATSDPSLALRSQSSPTHAAPEISSATTDARSESGGGSRLGRAAKLLSAAATTIVDKASGGFGSSRKIVEPIAPPGGLANPRNVPFDQLGDSSDELGATPLDKFRKSSFTPVGEDELGELPDVEDEQPSSIFVKFRVFWIAFVFVAFAALGVAAFRAPSADRLYSKIDRTFSRSTAKRFDATLRRSERDMKRFVDLYPNDPRAEKVNFFLCEIQIDELDQRLERQVVNTGRDAPLQPIMRAYLDARRAALVDWEDGSKKLAAFIELFGSDAILTEIGAAEADAPVKAEGNASSLRSLVVQNRWKLWKGESAPVMSLPDQLVVIAKRRLAALDAEMKTTRRADLALLNDRLITAESLEHENPERAAAIRRAAEVLYGDSEWARSAFANSGASEAETSASANAQTDESSPDNPVLENPNEESRSDQNDPVIQDDAP